MSLNWNARALVVLVMLVGMIQAQPRVASAQQPGFRNVGDMSWYRFSSAAVALLDGRVLVVSDNTAELYNPATESFSFFAYIQLHGRGLSATRLLDGRVLVAGGQWGDASVDVAEIFDPVSGLFTPTGNLTTPRSFHAATRLADGRVLVTGGHRFNFSNSAVDSAELFDPATGTFTPVGSMSVARESHTATLLPDGRVLVAGGYGTAQAGLTAADTFNPANGTFTPTSSLAAARGEHSATLLGNGRVLIAGGHDAVPGGSLATTELYDPLSNNFTSSGSMTEPRGAHATAMLSDGRLFVAGGFSAFPFSGPTLASAEIYDSGTGTFAPTASMPVARGRFMAVALSSGDVLVAGGLGSFGNVLNQAEVFTLSLVDNKPPVITVPSDIQVIAQDAQGAFVYFYVSVADDVDVAPQLECSPQSGSQFPLGVTSVLCTATDSAGNVANASFNVTVIERLAITLTIDAIGLVDPNTGAAIVSGTLSCTRATQFFSTSGELSQVISNRATVSGSFFAQASCQEGAAATWSGTIVSPNGRFKAGKATTSASAFACDNLGSCAFVGASGSVQLRAKK